MSTYEDYATTSAFYDGTRWALGAEIVVGLLATGATPLHEVTLLDAGCGTGNYAAVVLPHVARVEAVDASQGMLDVAGRKLAGARNARRVDLLRASIDDLPLDDDSVDAVMVNQVLHHLGDSPGTGWRRHAAVVGEFARVLRPGGTLVVNTCSQAQLRDGYWYHSLIPRAAASLRDRYAPLDLLEGLLSGQGLTPVGRFVPVDGVIQGDAYLDPHGPLRDDWRSGDSTWALADDAELAQALQHVHDLDGRDALPDDVAGRDARRPQVGQITFLGARSVRT